MSNQSFKNQLNKSNTGNAKVQFKRLFIQSGKEYVLRPVSTVLQDPDSLLFKKIALHGGFKHPNYDNEYPSNFVCIGKGCPLCKHANDLAKSEKANNVAKDQKTAWRKQRKLYAMYFMINQENQELTLVFVPNDVFKKAVNHEDGTTEWVPTSKSLQELLYEKLSSAADQDINPFDLNNGRNIHISSTVVEKVTKWSVSISNEKQVVSDKNMLKKLENVDLLTSIYKKLSVEDLQHIADGTKIPSKKEAAEQRIDKKESKISEQAQSISEQDYDSAQFQEDQDLESQLLGDFELEETDLSSSSMFSGMFSKDNQEE